MLACLVLLAAGCADADPGPSAGTLTASSRALTDVPARPALGSAPGGDAPIAEFSGGAASDAIGYWTSVFARSGVAYRRPAVTVLDGVGDDGCGADVDPDATPFALCTAAGPQTIITLGGSGLDELRASNGDAAVLVLAGLAVAVDAGDQLRGAPAARGRRVAATLAADAMCLTGAWIRRHGDRALLQAAHDLEVLDAAGRALGTAVTGDGIDRGFAGGVSACGGDGAAPAGARGAPPSRKP